MTYVLILLFVSVSVYGVFRILRAVIRRSSSRLWKWIWLAALLVVEVFLIAFLVWYVFVHFHTVLWVK